MKALQHELVVVGAGSGGFAAARTAHELGADVALVDHGPLGGLCILRGCMPSKTLLASSDRAQDIREAIGLGLQTDALKIDFSYIMRRKRELIAGFAKDRIDEIRRFPLYGGHARFLSPTQLQVGDDVIIEAPKFIVATGSLVAAPMVNGLAETGYIDSDRALELDELPQSLIVLGGGYVGTELGQFFSRMGVKTTIVFRSAHLLSDEDHDIGNALTDYYREEGIDVKAQTQIIGVSKRGIKKNVRILCQGIEAEIEADEILYSLGRLPNIEGLDLERANVKASKITGIEIDRSLHTSNPQIFAIGDVTGEFPLVHVAIYQGEVAARNAVRNDSELADYHLMKAHTIFCEPQVAVVGERERSLQANDITYLKATYDFAEHGKAMAIEKTKGFVKMLAAPKSGEILGASILGVQASDLIHEIIVAMRYKATVFEFIKIPHLHPTLAEIWTYPAQEIAEKIDAPRVNER